VSRVVRGRVWKLGDDVDTDQLAPWSTLSSPWEERRAAILRARPELVQQVRPGDVLVAGRNFGCGSSREQAPENLKLLGLGGVVAESFGRIYFRNCVAIAFPNLACPGIAAGCEDGDDLCFDVRTGRVENHSRGLVLAAPPWTAEMVEILEQGGLLAVLRRRVAAGRGA
jgi:3-isopropylmalate dehydratase small subunit